MGDERENPVLKGFDSKEALQRLIDDKIQEGVGLEFKSGQIALDRGNRSKTLAKAVSAFANSQGGILIIGIKTGDHNVGRGKERFEVPIEVDGVDPNDLSSETIVNILSSNIQPSVPGVTVDTISFSETPDARVVYKISVPASPLAPHMCEHKYFKRTSTSSLPMEHYEIEDIRGRKKGSDLRAELSITSIPGSSQGNIQVLLACVLRNYSESPASFALLRFYLGEGAKVIAPGNFDVQPVSLPVEIGLRLFRADTMLVYKINAYSGTMPLWGGLPFSTGNTTTLDLTQSFSNSQIDFSTFVIVRLDSPEMRPKLKVFRLTETNGIVRSDEESSFDPTALMDRFDKN